MRNILSMEQTPKERPGTPDRHPGIQEGHSPDRPSVAYHRVRISRDAWCDSPLADLPGIDPYTCTVLERAVPELGAMPLVSVGDTLAVWDHDRLSILCRPGMGQARFEGLEAVLLAADLILPQPDMPPVRRAAA